MHCMGKKIVGGGVFVYKLRVNTEFLLLFVVGVGRKKEEKNEKKLITSKNFKNECKMLANVY